MWANMVLAIQVLGLAYASHLNRFTMLMLKVMVPEFGVLLCWEVYGPDCREAGPRILIKLGGYGKYWPKHLPRRRTAQVGPYEHDTKN